MAHSQAVGHPGINGVLYGSKNNVPRLMRINLNNVMWLKEIALQRNMALSLRQSIGKPLEKTEHMEMIKRPLKKSLRF